MVRKKVGEVFHTTKTHASKFKNEFKKALVTAVSAAFGFLIALVWKDVITEYVNKIAEISPIKGRIIGALLVTIICVVGIVVLSYFVSDD